MGSGLSKVVRRTAPWLAVVVTAQVTACGSSHGRDTGNTTSSSGEGGADNGATSLGGRSGSASGTSGTASGHGGAGGAGAAGAAGTTRGGSAGASGSTTGGAAGTTAGGAGRAGSAVGGEAGGPDLPDPPPGWTKSSEFPVPDSTRGSTRPVVTLESTGVAQVIALAQDLLVASFDTQATFGTPEVLETDYIVNRPAMGIDPNDVSFAVWQGPSTNDRSDELLASRHPPGGSWSTPVALGSGARDADELALAVSANGTAVAVWIWPTVAVRYTHFDGTSWSEPSDVSPLEANSLALPSVSLDANGKGLVVWRDVAPGDVIGASRFDGTAFDTPTDLCPESSTECYLPAVAVNAAGDGVAAFELDYNLSAIPFDRSLGWQAPELVTKLDRADYGAAPKLGYTASNDLIAIWREEITDYDFRCTGAVKTGAGWSTPIQLQPEHGETDSKALAVAPDGRAVAIWGTNAYDTAGVRFWAAYYRPSSGWEPAFVLDEGGTSPSEVAAAINASGQAVLAWTRWESPPRVRVARYDPP